MLSRKGLNVPSVVGSPCLRLTLLKLSSFWLHSRDGAETHTETKKYISATCHNFFAPFLRFWTSVKARARDHDERECTNVSLLAALVFRVDAIFFRKMESDNNPLLRDAYLSGPLLATQALSTHLYPAVCRGCGIVFLFLLAAGAGLEKMEAKTSRFFNLSEKWHSNKSVVTRLLADVSSQPGCLLWHSRIFGATGSISRRPTSVAHVMWVGLVYVRWSTVSLTLDGWNEFALWIVFGCEGTCDSMPEVKLDGDEWFLVFRSCIVVMATFLLFEMISENHRWRM